MNQVFRDEARQASFERQGFTIARLMSEAQAADLLEDLEEIRKRAVPSHQGDIDQSFCTPDAEYRRRADAVVADAIRDPLLALTVDYRLSGCGVMIKKPRTGAMDIHRDRTILADLDLAPLAIWCPLVDIDDRKGNLALLPGSHKLPNVETPGVKRFYADYGAALKVLCVSQPLLAGEAVLFDYRILHWSRPNRFDSARPVVRATALPAGCRQVFFRLDTAFGGRRFEILDSEADGAVAHSPDDFAMGKIPAPSLGYAENNNREVSLRECRDLALRASRRSPLGLMLGRVRSSLGEVRDRLSR